MDVVSLTLSDPKEIDLILYRGDSGQFRISVSDDSGPLDVSDAEWKAEIRHKLNDAVILTEFDFVPVVGDTSKVDVFLTSDKSRLLNSNATYDVEMTRGDKVVTLMFGAIILTKDVTRP